MPQPSHATGSLNGHLAGIPKPVGAYERPVAPPWKTAALPPLIVLGLLFPVMFLGYIEQYLYYLRPLELLPTYGTAWLVHALATLPVWVVAALILEISGARGRRGLQRCLELIVYVIALTLAGAAILYGVFEWLRTFGLFHIEHVRRVAALISLPFAALIVALRRERALLDPIAVFATVGTTLGLVAAASIPFFGWPTVARNAAGSPLAPTASAPNILLLTIDALSAQYMSLYGAARATTPQLARFAQAAMVFDHAYANANFTTSGVTSILTGTMPWTHRALQLPGWPLEETRRNSLPALLRRSGYQMGYVSTNANAGANKNGLGGYFDFASTDRVQGGPALRALACSDGLSAILRYSCAAAQLRLFPGTKRLENWLSFDSRNQGYDPRLAIVPALGWLQRVDKTRPVFLWVHLYPPHDPYPAPEPWLGKFDSSDLIRNSAQFQVLWAFALQHVPAAQAHALEARYDESILYVDHYAGELLEQALQALGENTAVVITADHGESFGHGYGAHAGPALYDELIHVPLLIKLPLQHQGAHSAVTVQQVDIAPTLAALVGIAKPSSWEGRSLLGAWRGPNPDPEEIPVYSMNFEENRFASQLTTGSVAVIDGGWKLVHFLGNLRYALMPELHDELYDLRTDPSELENLAAANPVETHQLRNLIDAQLAIRGRAVH